MNTRTIELPDGWTEGTQWDAVNGRTVLVLLDKLGLIRAEFLTTDDPAKRSQSAWIMWVSDTKADMIQDFARQLRIEQEDFNIRRRRMTEDFRADIARLDALAVRHEVEPGEPNGLEDER